MATPHRYIPVFVESARAKARNFLAPKTKLNNWLQKLPQERGIHSLSDNSPYAHSEDDYDSHYGHSDGDNIDKIVGTYILDAAGFVPETILEVACGSGHLTCSLLYDGRVKRLVASDASERFLEITKRKAGRLPTCDRLDLVRLADADFDAIPAGVFDAIMMRSALHHFVDFKGVAATLVSKLKPGGGLFMLEPRADFHIASSLILKCAKAKATHGGLSWTETHQLHTQLFIDSAEFYLNRTRTDKAFAEDKYVFHLDELLEIADLTGTTLRCLGGEDDNTFSTRFRDFMHFCMSFDPDVLADIMALAAEELAFMDRAYETHSRYAAAEWFLFRRR
ncbi:MAG: class I SAM-dependent methyltransferase [Proteobacteria bacterium]|nr:class I SAM-dependent methyltransferase [Pseudomonadota bacterium]